MDELKVYTHPDFGNLEVWIGPDGKNWYPATESAEMLKYANPQKAIRDHCEKVGERNVHPSEKGVNVSDPPSDIANGVAFREVIDRLGRPQKKKYINRPNLSRLITNSHLPDAKRFEAWIFDDVLESVFDHGMYAMPMTVEAMLEDPDTMIKILQNYKATREKNKALEAKNTLLLEEKHDLETELDKASDWYTIKRVAAMTGRDWTEFDWRRLKGTSQYLGYEVKKIFDANYGAVNAYHHDVWRQEYPHVFHF